MAAVPAPGHTNTTITAGGTAQVGAAADPTRRQLMVQNNSAEDMWLNFFTTAAADTGIRLQPGQAWEGRFADYPMIINAMSIIAATTGSKFGLTADVN